MNEWKFRVCSTVGYLLSTTDSGVNKSPLYRCIQRLFIRSHTSMSILITAFKIVNNELSKMACIFIQFCK